MWHVCKRCYIWRNRFRKHNTAFCVGRSVRKIYDINPLVKVLSRTRAGKKKTNLKTKITIFIYPEIVTDVYFQFSCRRRHAPYHYNIIIIRINRYFYWHENIKHFQSHIIIVFNHRIAFTGYLTVKQ